jgi:hypothetical protein
VGGRRVGVRVGGIGEFVTVGLLVGVVVAVAVFVDVPVAVAVAVAGGVAVGGTGVSVGGIGVSVGATVAVAAAGASTTVAALTVGAAAGAVHAFTKTMMSNKPIIQRRDFCDFIGDPPSLRNHKACFNTDNSVDSLHPV